MFPQLQDIVDNCSIVTHLCDLSYSCDLMSLRVFGNRALDVTIQGSIEYTRILGIPRERGVLEVDDATELDVEEIRSTLSDEDMGVCCDF